MSREVIGTGTDTAPDDAPPSRPAARLDLPDPRTPPVTLDDAGPLHATAARPPGPAQPSAWSGRWGARPALAGAAIAGLLIGALLGTGAAERTAAGERAQTVRLVGGLHYPAGGLPSPPTGPIEVDLVVVNAGPETVRVTAVGLGPGTTSTLSLAAPFDVDPGQVGRAEVDLTLDCLTPALGEVSLTVRSRAGLEREVTLAPDDLGRSVITEDVGYVCEDLPAFTTLDVFSITSRGGGSLGMQVRNPTDAPVAIAFAGPVGTVLVTDPASPIRLAPRSSVFLVLRVQVDECTAAATRPDAGDDLALTVDGERDRAFLDPVVTSGWLAREVALACPGT